MVRHGIFRTSLKVLVITNFWIRIEYMPRIFEYQFQVFVSALISTQFQCIDKEDVGYLRENVFSRHFHIRALKMKVLLLNSLPCLKRYQFLSDYVSNLTFGIMNVNQAFRCVTCFDLHHHPLCKLHYATFIINAFHLYKL